MKPELKTKYYESGAKSSEVWYLNDKYHNETGPAYIYYYESGTKEYEGWYLNGKRHNETGPTRAWYNEDGTIKDQEWYINDKEYTEEEFRYYQLINKLAGL